MVGSGLGGSHEPDNRQGGNEEQLPVVQQLSELVPVPEEPDQQHKKCDGHSGKQHQLSGRVGIQGDKDAPQGGNGVVHTLHAADLFNTDPAAEGGKALSQGIDRGEHRGEDQFCQPHEAVAGTPAQCVDAQIFQGDSLLLPVFQDVQVGHGQGKGQDGGGIEIKILGQNAQLQEEQGFPLCMAVDPGHRQHGKKCDKEAAGKLQAHGHHMGPDKDHAQGKEEGGSGAGPVCNGAHHRSQQHKESHGGIAQDLVIVKEAQQ